MFIFKISFNDCNFLGFLAILTATPLQNSLLELYGLVSIIDPHIFGDINSFKELYVRSSNLSLRNSNYGTGLVPRLYDITFLPGILGPCMIPSA